MAISRGDPDPGSGCFENLDGFAFVDQEIARFVVLMPVAVLVLTHHRHGAVAGPGPGFDDMV